MKSSTHYFHVKTEILADFQICISVSLTFVMGAFNNYGHNSGVGEGGLSEY